MKKARLTAIAAPIALSALLASCGQQDTDELFKDILTPKSVYHADLNPINIKVQSGLAAHGGATLTLEGNILTVKIEADDLLPNKPHPQHIHGFDMGLNLNAVCPPEEAANNDLNMQPQTGSSQQITDDDFISLNEGEPFYGPIKIPLVLGTLESDMKNFPVADDQGRINYTEVFTLTDEQVKTITPLYKQAIVLHGTVINGEYQATVPIACGELEEQ